MAWYRKNKTIEASIEAVSDIEPFLKTAISNKFPEERSNEIQSIWVETYGDIQRYKSDAFSIRITKTKTNYKISVAVEVWHAHNGQMIWQDFWKLGKNEDKLADKMCKDFKEKADKIMRGFIEEEKPTPMLYACIKSEFRKLYPEKLAQTNIPSINYSLRYPSEADWRSSIYGNRYPSPDNPGADTTGF